MFKHSIQHNIASLCILLCMLITSCRDDAPLSPQGRYRNGVFVVNEGSGAGSGDVSFFDLDSNKVINNLFARENTPARLGTFVQSMLVHNDKAYICVDNGNQVAVVNSNTFAQEATIRLKVPHTMIADGNTGYVTEWIKVDYVSPPKGRVSVINLQTNSVTDSISTDGAFPTRMILTNTRLYVLNSLENTVSIINTQTKRLERKVTVGDSPVGIVLDRNNDIWVLTAGVADFSQYPIIITIEPGKLLRFTPSGSDLTQKSSFTLGAAASSGDRLIVNPDRNVLYYTFDGKVFTHAIEATSLSTIPFLSRSFYGIGINPAGDLFYGGVAPDFTSNGKMIRYNLTTKAPVDSATVGIAPSGFVFK